MRNAAILFVKLLICLSQVSFAYAQKANVPLGSSLFTLGASAPEAMSSIPSHLWDNRFRAFSIVQAVLSIEGRSRPVHATLRFDRTNEPKLESVAYSWESETQEAQQQEWIAINAALRKSLGAPTLVPDPPWTITQYCVNLEPNNHTLAVRLYIEDRKTSISVGKRSATCPSSLATREQVASLALFRVSGALPKDSLKFSLQGWPSPQSAKKPSAEHESSHAVSRKPTMTAECASEWKEWERNKALTREIDELAAKRGYSSKYDDEVKKVNREYEMLLTKQCPR